MPREKIVKRALVDGTKSPQKQPDTESATSSRGKCFFAIIASVIAVVLTAAIVVGVYFSTRQQADKKSEDNMYFSRSKVGAKPALALEGGGFLAHSVYTGLVEGLNQAASKTGGTEATLTATNILGSFGVISTVSGGSWFMSELAFSQRFLSLVEGSNEANAATNYINKWVEPFISIGSKNIGVKVFADLISALGASGLAQTLKQIAYFLGKGMVWSSFVERLLGITGSIAPTTQLGDDVNAWAKDKIWIVAHSVVTPGGSCSYCKKKVAKIWQKLAGLDFADYKISDSSSSQPLFTPARYSIVLGSGSSSRAPLPYCAPGMCEGLGLSYEGATWAGVDRFSSSATLNFGGTEQSSGALPLTQAVAASSSFLGGICTSDATDLAQELVGTHFEVWTATTGGGDAFTQAQASVQGLSSKNDVSRTSLQALSAQGLHAVIDGGYTDNTGIAHAIAVGANEVVSFVVSVDDLLNLFAGRPAQKNQALGVYELYFQAFQESATEIQKQINTFQPLSISIGSTKFLKSLTFGTLTVTTVDCPAFGITAGRKITLHVVSVDSPLTIGGLDDFKDYGTLVGEITSTIVSNLQGGTTQKLLKILLGDTVQG